MTEFVSVVRPGLSGINMQGVMNRWFDACSRRLGIYSMNYSDVACLFAIRATGIAVHGIC